MSFSRLCNPLFAPWRNNLNVGIAGIIAAQAHLVIALAGGAMYRIGAGGGGNFDCRLAINGRAIEVPSK